jgi:hypothetical protein
VPAAELAGCQMIYCILCTVESEQVSPDAAAVLFVNQTISDSGGMTVTFPLTCGGNLFDYSTMKAARLRFFPHVILASRVCAL